MMNILFYNVMPCILVEEYAEDDSSRFFINVGILQPNYTTSHKKTVI